MTRKPPIFVVLILGLIAFEGAQSAAVDPQCDNESLVDAINIDANERHLFESLVNVAECYRKAASSVGAEWLNTEEIITLARQEADQNNWDEALTLANKAMFQAVSAVQQAKHESEAWKNRVLE